MALQVTAALPFQNQGLFVLNNRQLPDVNAPIVLVERESGRIIRPEGPDWEVQVLVGPSGDQLQEVTRRVGPRPSFRTGRAAGYFTPTTILVPNVPGGEKAVVELVISPKAAPDLRLKFGPYTVTLAEAGRVPEPLPMGSAPITNTLPAGFLERVREKPPAIPGEPSYDGLPLSYWLLGFERLPDPMGGSPLTKPGHEQSARALSAMGIGAVPYVLLRQADTNQFTAGLVVIAALAEIGRNDQVDRVVWGSLQNTNAVVRKNAIRGLPCKLLADNFDALRGMAVDQDAEFKRFLLRRFGQCQVRNAALLPDWMSLLQSTDVNDQREALGGLKLLGTIAQPATNQIEEIFRRDNPATFVPAAGAMWAATGKTDILGPLVARFSVSDDWILMRQILELLGEMGPAARSAVPAIVARFNQQNQDPPFPPVLMSAREALRKIEPGSEAKLPNEQDLMNRPHLIRPASPPKALPFG